MRRKSKRKKNTDGSFRDRPLGRKPSEEGGYFLVAIKDLSSREVFEGVGGFPSRVSSEKGISGT